MNQEQADRRLKLYEAQMVEHALRVACHYLDLLREGRRPDDPDVIEARAAHQAFEAFPPGRWWPKSRA